MAKRKIDDYEVQINAILDDLLGSEFSYDPAEDPLYKQYEATYTRLGDRAARDAYGETAARTGGYGSSYAATAAAQANNVYMSELAGKIPALYEAAYAMYEQDADRKMDYAGLLNSLGREYYDRALEKAKALAKRGDWTGYKSLGYTDKEIARLRGW